MSPYFMHLKFPFEPALEEFAKFEVHPRDLEYLVKDHSTGFDDRVVQLLATLGLRIGHTALFYTPPRALLPIHMDLPDRPSFAKLNFAYGGTGSKMIWYRLKPGFVPTPVETEDTLRYKAPRGSVSYVNIPGNQAVPVVSTKIGITVVNAGLPHSVLNNTDEARWVISCPIRDIAEDRLVDFEELTERLAPLAQ